METVIQLISLIIMPFLRFKWH